MPSFSKMMFTTALIVSSLVSISSYSWTGMWLGLEMNLLSFIPLMSEEKTPISGEASTKYFIVQAMASTVILTSMITESMKSGLMSLTAPYVNPSLLLGMALLTKMGMAPFHFWFPEVLEGLTWKNCMIILTWQKIAPMTITMYSTPLSMLNHCILISVIISGTLGLNTVSLRKIMAYSSINHMAWMMSTVMLAQTIWMYYLLVYSIITINMTTMFDKTKSHLINQLNMNSKDPMTKLMFILNFLSLSGIPPFLGFIPKWITTQFMIENNMILTATIMIAATMVMIFVYTRVLFTSMIIESHQLSWMTAWEWPSIKLWLTNLNSWTISSTIVITISMFS